MREVVTIALAEEADRYSGSTENLRYNRPALATLALLHLWRRHRLKSDRDTLVAIATRRDQAGVPAFGAALQMITGTDIRLLKAGIRAAFAGYRWRWHPHDEDEAVQKAFEDEREAAVRAAVAAEIAWLDGGDEPGWPSFPDEKPILRTSRHIRIPGGKEELDERLVGEVAEDGPSIHVESHAASRWLRLLNEPEGRAGGWADEIVAAYFGWTERINGGRLPSDVEVDRSPDKWNMQFYALFAKELLEAEPRRFDDLIEQVTNLPDKSFGDVAETLLHAADVLYFNDPSRPADRPVSLRTRMAARTMEMRSWRYNYAPGDLSIDYDTGGVVAKLFLNTHDPFNGTRSYLVPAVADRLDPLLEPLRPLLPGGPTSFVALCTMNLLLVAPRARHLDFLLTAVEAWFESLPTDGALWVTMGIGRKVVEWFEAAMIQEPGLLGPTHPYRMRIDHALGRLVAVGIADAHDLENRIQTAAVTEAAGGR